MSSDVLLEAHGLRKRFPLGRGRYVDAIDDVSFAIPRGRTFGLVGESGSGKSTLARALLGLVPLDAGTVTYDGRDVGRLGRGALRSLRRHVQIVFQDPYASLNRRHTVAQIVAAPLEAHHAGDRASRARRVDELMDLVGLGRWVRDRRPHELSGGQCQRVSIARALALEPEFLVLDEAVSALDVSIQAQILNLLRRLQRQLGLTYLFISHDLAVVRYMASPIAVMHRGRIVELGTREQLFTAPAHPYTRSLLAAIPVPNPDRARPPEPAGSAGAGG